MAACIAFLIWQFFFARAPVPPAVTENENTQSAPTVAQAEPVPVQTMTSLEVRGADQEQVADEINHFVAHRLIVETEWDVVEDSGFANKNVLLQSE